ncbi:MAG TPA: hypothetical protein VE129_08785 [Thermoanaerobaculia bacterium]|nr:hypothetical protein [Thermoanaerobaculia bacterium]
MRLFAVLALLAAPGTPETPQVLPRPVVGYVLVESRKTFTPAGEQASAVRGSVTVLGGTARWDLETGTFPRTKANTLLLGDREGWLLDRKASVAAQVRVEDVRSLFIPPAAGDPGPFQSAVSDLEVPPAELVSGPSFEGSPTVRLRVSASWSLVTSMPGRVGRVRCKLTASLDALADPPEGTRSPLDDLGRLFDVSPQVLEALAPELARLRGFPVRVVVETEAELGVDYPGMAAPPSDGRAPLRSRTETTRIVSELTSWPATGKDSARFTLSEETRVIGIERLVEPRESLR